MSQSSSTYNTTGTNSSLYYLPHLSPSLSPSILYRSTHANIPTAARLNAFWKTLTPLWNGPVVWATGNWTVDAPVTTKWALLHIWIKLPGGRASLNTTQSLSWSWICLIGSVTLTTSPCQLSLLVAALRTWERWRRRKRKRRKRRRQGIYSRRSLAGWRAPSLVCTRPVPVLLWSHVHLLATPLRLFLFRRLTSQLQSSTTQKLCGTNQLNMMKTD